MITLTPEILGEHVVSQRWFGEKSRDISEIVFVEAIPVRDHDPRLDLAIVEVRFATGTHALYQLPVGERPEGEELPDADVIHEGEGRVLYDALADPVLVRELVEAMGEDRQVDTSNEYHLGKDQYQGRPYGLGPRVPMYVVSPWSKGGFVNSQVFDHTSVLRFLETRFGVKEPNISAWRRAVSGDLTSCFDFSRGEPDTVALPR